MYFLIKVSLHSFEVEYILGLPIGVSSDTRKRHVGSYVFAGRNWRVTHMHIFFLEFTWLYLFAYFLLNSHPCYQCVYPSFYLRSLSVQHRLSLVMKVSGEGREVRHTPHIPFHCAQRTKSVQTIFLWASFGYVFFRCCFFLCLKDSGRRATHNSSRVQTKELVGQVDIR